jgi:hypothetical protein
VTRGARPRPVWTRRTPPLQFAGAACMCLRALLLYRALPASCAPLCTRCHQLPRTRARAPCQCRVCRLSRQRSAAPWARPTLARWRPCVPTQTRRPARTLQRHRPTKGSRSLHSCTLDARRRCLIKCSGRGSHLALLGHVEPSSIWTFKRGPSGPHVAPVQFAYTTLRHHVLYWTALDGLDRSTIQGDSSADTAPSHRPAGRSDVRIHRQLGSCNAAMYTSHIYRPNLIRHDASSSWD